MRQVEGPPPFSATPTAGCVKFGSSKNAIFNWDHLGLPQNVIDDLEEAAKHSLAIKTWSSYKTAEKSLIMFCKLEKVMFKLPLTEAILVRYIHWLVYTKGKRVSTVSSYLAGIRKMHVMRGMEAPVLRTEIVKMILTGRKNMEDSQRLRQGGQERQPVTPDILELIKARLRDWDTNGRDKCTVWTVATLLFHGAFRGGELLCRQKSEFDPAFTLLRSDIKVTADSSVRGLETVQVRLKAPKERKDNRAVIVDVYQADTSICPVRAVKKWMAATANYQPDQPAFRLADGSPLTASLFNRILDDRLSGYLENCKISAHSFRSGAASMMASLGYSDKDVKAVGRWSSRAFELYVKLPRTQRIQAAKHARKFGFK